MGSNKYLTYLSDKAKDESFVDRLKIKFRPLIFPMESLLSHLEETDSFFDIGCGSGQFALLVHHFKNVQKISGIEIKEELVKNANALFSKHAPKADAKFVKYDGIHFPETIKNYNKVFLNDVLHHVPQKVQTDFLKKIYESISDDTVFVLKDIDAASPLVYFNKIHDLVFSREIGRELTCKAAKETLETIGFKILAVEKKTIAVYPHYTIICKK
ncbi:tRNA (cmo5U34)-methyltransferase [Kordia antarctica]|uniref:tRNA (Cmo5U34)-methyltransferase n=1 Tax=Kordia antarctica TaxID=1218801 RepID=A0A7L4ZEU0_9FLAO|nr:class I SAM-dependent methyltransferase [Kordia antarctica]QHI35238.1 tRNA (cmo5U34)-methyltransferase [Kordia antarctica]